MGTISLKTELKNPLSIIRGAYVNSIGTSEGAVSPYIMLNLQGEYADSQPINLAASTSTNVQSVTYSVEVVSTDYGTCTTAINNGVLEFTSHFEGKIKIKAYATNDEDVNGEQTVDVYCTDVASYQYSVSDVVVNGGQNANATDTGVGVTFVGHKTPVYASGRLGDTEDIDVTENVTFAANTTGGDITRNGTIVWNGVNINWTIVQVANKYIRFTLDNSYEDSSQIELSNFTDTNINNLIYNVDVVSTEYGEFEGYIDGTKLVCVGHFDGVIKVTAFDEGNTVSAEKNVTIYCNDLVTEHEVSDIVVNNGENIPADATSFNVVFTGTTTTYYESGKTGFTTNIPSITQVIEIEPNDSTEINPIEGYFNWNGVRVDWSAIQNGVTAAISQETLDLIDYYGVERTDAQIEAVDTFLSELKAHSAYEHLTDVVIPILAPKSDKTEIEGYIASDTEKDTSNYPEIQKAFRNIINDTVYTRNIRSWFIGKNGIRIYKTNTSKKYIQYSSNITFNTALLSGGICTNIPTMAKVCDIIIRGDNAAVRVNNSSWKQSTITHSSTEQPKMYATSINGSNMLGALNGVSGNQVTQFTLADGDDTTYSTNKLLRIDSSTTSNGLSTSFDDPNGLVVSAFFLCKDYAMSQEELNSITLIFRKLILAFWKD